MKKSTKIKLRAVLTKHGMAQKRRKRTLKECFITVQVIDIYTDWQRDTRLISNQEICECVRQETGVHISRDTVKSYTSKLRKQFPTIRLSACGRSDYHIATREIIIAMVKFLKRIAI